MVRPRRTTVPIERLSAEVNNRKHRQAHMTTALAAAVASGDMFTMLAVDHIQKEGTAKPTAEHLRRPDFEPANRKQMLETQYVNKWIEGEKEELAPIKKNDVWHKVPPPLGTKVLPLKWIYKVKKDRMGTVVRNKCRLVAQGFFQVFGEDYDQTYSPVAKFTSIRTLLALSAQLGLTVRQMDVDTAFLSEPIEEDIWVQLPKGSRPEGDEDDGVYKLKKSLYGLKQAPREWNKCINEFLVSIGFTNTEADPCIYKRTEKGPNNKDQYTIVALYVDDLIIATSF